MCRSVEVFEPKEYLSDQSMDMYATILRHNLKLLDVHTLAYIPTALSRGILNDSGIKVGLDFKQSELCDVLERRLCCLRFFFERAQVMLIPVFSDGGCRHWTLLALRKKGVEVEVRYYDSLPALHPGCLRCAGVLVKCLGLEATLSRRNVSRQTGIECGLFVCHYLENEMRDFCGQGEATQPWPNDRLKTMRVSLKTWHTTLRAVHEKWAAQEVKDKEKAVEMEKRQAKRARELLEKKGLLHKLAEAQAMLAASLLSAGAGEHPPPFPEGFGAKPAKVSEVKLQELGEKGADKAQLEGGEAKGSLEEGGKKEEAEGGALCEKGAGKGQLELFFF